MDEQNKDDNLADNPLVKEAGSTAVTALTGIPKPASDLIVDKVAKDPRIQETLNRVTGKNRMPTRQPLESNANYQNGYSDDNNTINSDNMDNGDSNNEEESEQQVEGSLSSISNKIIKGNNKIYFSIILIAAFFIIIIFLIGFAFPTIKTINFGNDDSMGNQYTDLKNKEYERLYYEKLNGIQNKYKNEKNVTINKELITAVLTFNKDFGSFLTTEDLEDNSLASNEDAGESIYKTAIKKIDLLAKFQIVNPRYSPKGCDEEGFRIIVNPNSLTPQNIAKNDGMLSFLGDEKNYKDADIWGEYPILEDGTTSKICTYPPTANAYVDVGLNGVFYNNLLEEGFLDKAYYKEIFEGMTDSERKERLIKLVEDIYSLASIKGGINATAEFTPNPGSVISPLPDSSSCHINQWSNGVFSHGGVGETMALDINPTSTTGSCESINGKSNCGCKGDPILAITDGTITHFHSPMGEYGSCSSNGILLFGQIDSVDSKVLYEHLYSYTVEDGAKVKQGDIIGYMGSTGYSTAVHLHLQIALKNEEGYEWQNLDDLFKTKFNCS